MMGAWIIKAINTHQKEAAAQSDTQIYQKVQERAPVPVKPCSPNIIDDAREFTMSISGPMLASANY